MVRLDLDRIRQARTAIDPVFLDSPQYEYAPLGDALGCSITLKIESLNPVRSFKGRGTETALSRLAQHQEAPTAVCASAGNLGQALAYSGARRGRPGDGQWGSVGVPWPANRRIRHRADPTTANLRRQDHHVRSIGTSGRRSTMWFSRPGSSSTWTW